MQRYINELQLLHAIRLAVVATDRDGLITFANDAATRLYGGAREELVGRSLADFLTDAGNQDTVRAELWHVMAGQQWSGDVSLRTLTGAPFLAQVVATPLLDADGHVIGLVVVAEDITDVRLAEAEAAASERRLRLAHDAARLGSWQWDLAAGTNIWDRRLEEIFGLPQGGFDGTFEAWAAMIHPDDLDEAMAVVEEAMASCSSYLLKMRVVWPDGTVRSIESWGQVTSDGEGNATGTLGCVRDVTDELETQKALALALEAERQASARMSLLLAVTTGLSGARTTSDVRRTLTEHLDTFHDAFGGRVVLQVPDLLTAVRTGQDLVVSGHEDLGPAQRSLLDSLAAQCAAAAVRADLQARTSEIAEDLQLGLAASPLPDTQQVEIAVRYAPGGSELEHVGGDWYDAVRTREGHLAFVVGDVMGRGVRAATTMIRVRAALRGMITVDPSPEHLLAFADELLARDAPDQFVTAAAALLDPTTGRLRLCLAGHIPLVLVHPDGSTELHGEDSGIPLGVQAGVVRDAAEMVVPPGSLLVLVTDGVVESRTGDLDDGITRLRERAAELRTRPLDELAAGIAALADSSMRDDVTVLAIRVR